MESFSVRAIGMVESPVAAAVDQGWGAVTARVVLFPQFHKGLRGLEQFSHLVVVTFLHQAAWDPARDLVRRPRGLAELPELGIFAQRAKDRPNPIGITAVRIVSVGPDSVTVQGLDAVDKTPVLDLKPYVPQYDRVGNPVVPAWVDSIMRDYF